MNNDLPKRPAHRPLIPIDWEQVDKMCAIQCTGEEIANVLSVDYDTLAVFRIISSKRNQAAECL